MSNGTKHRLLRACLQPLVVTAVDPAGISALRIDPELLWAACLSELEQVEVRLADKRSWQVPVLPGGAGEVEVQGSLGGQVVPGEVLSVLAYAYVSGPAVPDHAAQFVLVGEGNRAIEISQRRAQSFPVHPSYALPVAAEARFDAT